MHLGRFGGTQVWLDASWVPVLPFAAWSLAVVYFPGNYPIFDPVSDWLIGLAGAAGLLASTVLHEAVHVLVARHRGIVPRAIVIGVIGSGACPWCGDGGVDTAVATAVGPVTSTTLALATFWGALNAGALSRPLEALLGYLAIVNALLALLHTLPAWPFDAGWLVRLVLVRMGLTQVIAERVPVALGAMVAGCLVVLGLWEVVSVRSSLLGTWIAVVGALVMWALPWTTYQRTPQAPRIEPYGVDPTR
jgi:Zn-dependent protease